MNWSRRYQDWVRPRWTPPNNNRDRRSIYQRRIQFVIDFLSSIVVFRWTLFLSTHILSTQLCVFLYNIILFHTINRYFVFHTDLNSSLKCARLAKSQGNAQKALVVDNSKFRWPSCTLCAHFLSQSSFRPTDEQILLNMCLYQAFGVVLEASSLTIRLKCPRAPSMTNRLLNYLPKKKKITNHSITSYGN